MAQLALTVAGYYFGGPIGGAIGSFIGGAIDRSQASIPDQYGPRLDDLKVTTSAYGTNMPYHFGTTRTAGSIIYAQDLREVENRTETEVGGKGGPTQTTITYTYFATFAVSLGYGIGRGIRRIWANGVLVWDVDIGASNPDAVALDFTFYPGTDDQLPDPTMEADLGVGKVPGYRGEIIVMFRDAPLEKFGNRIPSLDFELIMDDGEWGATDQVALDSPISDQYKLATQALDGSVIAVSETDPTHIGITRYDPTTGEALVSNTYAMNLEISSLVYVPPTNEVWVPGGPTGDTAYERFNADTLEHLGSVESSDVSYLTGGGFYDPTQRVVISLAGASAFFGYHWTVYELDGTLRSVETAATAASNKLVGGGSLVAVGFVPAATAFYIYDIAADTSTRLVDTVGTLGRGAAFDPTRNRYVAVEASTVWTIDDSLTPTPTDVTPTGFSVGLVSGMRYVGGLDAIEIFSNVAGTTYATVLDAETFEILYTGAIGTTAAGYSAIAVFGAQQLSPGTVFGVGLTQPWTAVLYGTSYAAAVRTLCLASGELESADVDVSTIGQRLYGYMVAQAGPVRSAIEQLARADLFDGVEEDDKLKFPRRGAATVATIPLDDCGAEFDEASDHAISSSRLQEIDLPARLYITAPDPFTDYQPGTQYGERLAHQAGDDENEQYAVVMTATTAKRLADARIFDRWACREPGSISTSRKYARLSPTDPVTLGGRRVRVTSRSDEGGVMRFEWVTEDADVIDQVSAGAQGAFTPQTVAVQVPTTLIVMDTALLRDGDDEPGAYVAAWGLAPYWRGTSIFASADGGVSYAAETTLGAPGSYVGEATTALGDWTGGNVFDEANSLTVRMHQGTPAGTTRAGVLAGNNGLAIEGPDGWEILQYRDVTLNGDGTYTLRGFLRGRRGTEWATAGHDIGDRVVMLSSSTMRSIRLDNADLGASLLYKAVTVGDTLTGTSSQAATVDGERLKPLAPVDLRALRDVGSGDITLAWRRRSRLSYRFLAEGIAPPLGEDSEAYVVTVFTDGTYTTSVRTIAASSETATYTSAQQVTDFGSNQSTVYVTVTQTSATVGAGHELQDAA